MYSAGHRRRLVVRFQAFLDDLTNPSDSESDEEEEEEPEEETMYQRMAKRCRRE